MKKDHKGLTLTRGRICCWNVGEVMELQAISEDKESMMKAEDGLRRIPVLISSCGWSVDAEVEQTKSNFGVPSSISFFSCSVVLRKKVPPFTARPR